MIPFTCPCCGKLVQMREDWTGRQARCPHSLQVIQTPAGTGIPEAVPVEIEVMLEVLPLGREGDADSMAADLAYMALNAPQPEQLTGWQAVLEKNRREQQRIWRAISVLLIAGAGVAVGAGVGASLGSNLGMLPKALFGALLGAVFGGIVVGSSLGFTCCCIRPACLPAKFPTG